MKKQPIISFFDLKRQYTGIKSGVDGSIRKVLGSGSFILGDEVRKFEEEFARYCGAGFASGVASGTEALYIALKSCGIGEGDEVITAANAGVPLVVAIEMAGAVPVFADVDPHTYLIDTGNIGKKVSRRTKAIMPIHLYGQCADMDGIMAVARKKGLKVIEDACQAHGAEYKGRKAGSMGDAGCFSFYPTKNLGCYGDGGMVVASDASIHKKVRLQRDYGQVKRYVHECKGINSRLDEMQAAVLRVKLRRLDSWNNKRAGIARKYGLMLDEKYILKPEETGEGRHAYHLYVITCGCRDKLRDYLRKNGIQTLIHYPSVVYAQKAYSGLARGNKSPVAERLCATVLSLPIYPEMAVRDIERVCEAINRFKP